MDKNSVDGGDSKVVHNNSSHVDDYKPKGMHDGGKKTKNGKSKKSKKSKKKSRKSRKKNSKK